MPATDGLLFFFFFSFHHYENEKYKISYSTKWSAQWNKSLNIFELFFFFISICNGFVSILPILLISKNKSLFLDFCFFAYPAEWLSHFVSLLFCFCFFLCCSFVVFFFFSVCKFCCLPFPSIKFLFLTPTFCFSLSSVFGVCLRLRAPRLLLLIIIILFRFLFPNFFFFILIFVLLPRLLEATTFPLVTHDVYGAHPCADRRQTGLADVNNYTPSFSLFLILLLFAFLNDYYSLINSRQWPGLSFYTKNDWYMEQKTSRKWRKY